MAPSVPPAEVAKPGTRRARRRAGGDDATKEESPGAIVECPATAGGGRWGGGRASSPRCLAKARNGGASAHASVTASRPAQTPDRKLLRVCAPIVAGYL